MLRRSSGSMDPGLVPPSEPQGRNQGWGTGSSNQAPASHRWSRSRGGLLARPKRAEPVPGSPCASRTASTNRVRSLGDNATLNRPANTSASSSNRSKLRAPVTALRNERNRRFTSRWAWVPKMTRMLRRLLCRILSRPEAVAEVRARPAHVTLGVDGRRPPLVGPPDRVEWATRGTGTGAEPDSLGRPGA